MRYYSFTLVLLIFFTGCCVDEITSSYMLSDEEKALIPYKSFQDFTFIDEEGNTFNAQSTPENNTVEVRYLNPHGCQQEEVETLNSTLNILSKDLSFDIRIEANFVTNIKLIKKSNTLYPFNLSLTSLNSQIHENFQDIIIHGFEYTNVLLFKNSLTNDPIHKIIYSTTNGIEFIEFANGKWLKLNL